MSSTKLSFINNVLIWLSGKKSIIASIIGTISAYLAANGIIGQNEVILIGAISTIVFGSASIATSNSFKKINTR